MKKIIAIVLTALMILLSSPTPVFGDERNAFSFYKADGVTPAEMGSSSSDDKDYYWDGNSAVIMKDGIIITADAHGHNYNEYIQVSGAVSNVTIKNFNLKREDACIIFKGGSTTLNIEGTNHLTVYVNPDRSYSPSPIETDWGDLTVCGDGSLTLDYSDAKAIYAGINCGANSSANLTLAASGNITIKGNYGFYAKSVSITKATGKIFMSGCNNYGVISVSNELTVDSNVKIECSEDPNKVESDTLLPGTVSEKKIKTTDGLNLAKSARFTGPEYFAITNNAPETSKASNNGYIVVKAKEQADNEVTVTDVPNDGYRLVTLSYNDGTDHDIKTDKKFTMPGKAVSVSATFELIPSHTITNLTAVGDKESNYGYIEVASSAKEGEDVDVTVYPNSNYELDTLVYNDGVADYNITETKTFTMSTSNVSVKATFKKIPVPSPAIDYGYVAPKTGVN